MISALHTPAEGRPRLSRSITRGHDSITSPSGRAVSTSRNHFNTRESQSALAWGRLAHSCNTASLTVRAARKYTCVYDSAPWQNRLSRQERRVAMPIQDLREWITKVDEMGELTRVDGADPHLELGGLVDLYQWDMENPALLFDHIKGQEPGYRVLANVFTSMRRIALARIHRRTSLGTVLEEAIGCSSESGIMVLEQKPARKQGGPNRCCDRTNPTVSASSLTTIAWWRMPACSYGHPSPAPGPAGTRRRSP